MTKLLGLIFDLDGTLVDSVADARQAINGLLQAHGRRGVSLDEVKSMVGDGLRVMLRRAFAATGEAMPDRAEATIFEDFLRIYQTQKASPDQLYSGVRDVLGFFHERGVKIGLCTNKIHRATTRILDDIGIADLFDFVAGGDSFPVCKPHPGHVLGVVAGLGVDGRGCVMIGDSDRDIDAARAAGIASIAVSHGYGVDVDALGADRVIGGFAELPEALRELGFEFLAGDVAPRG